MKIAQYYEDRKICLGIIEGEELRPLEYDGDMMDLIKDGFELKRSGDLLPVEDVDFAPPVTDPSKIVCIGLNYMDHIEESNGDVPDKPLIFAKFPSSLTGHKDCISWDSALTEKVDFEAELAVIIGRELYRCPEEDVMDGIFGYTCGNDVSARDLQFGDGQWVRGKTLDTFCPLGPWIVTADEIPDPHSLAIRCLLNGEVMQESNTGSMIFKLPRLISFLSMNFTLVPGDVILTGTPHGVGAFRDPSVYMKNGDEVIVEIEGIGALKNICLVK